MVPRLLAIARAKTFIGFAALLLVYTLAGFFLAPFLIEKYVPEYVQDSLKRRASIGDVRINPFTLSFEIRDFDFKEADERPILGFKRLYIHFELESLFRRAWTFGEISLEQPTLLVDRNPEGKLNLLQLADSFPPSEPEEPEPEPSSPPRLLLHLLALKEAEITYSDRSGQEPVSAKLSPLDLELEEISTLPERTGPYDLAATLPGGGSLTWEGQISLQPISSTGHITLTGGKPATAWRFLQDQLEMEEPAGTVDVSTNYRLRLGQALEELLLEDVSFTAKGISITPRSGPEPMLTLETVHLGEGRIDVPAQEIAFGKLEIGPGRITAAADPKGVLDWQKLYRPKAHSATPPPGGVSAQPSTPEPEPASTPAPGAASEPEPEAAPAPWKLNLAAARIADIAVQYRDEGRELPFHLDVGGLGLEFSVSLETGEAGPSGAVKDGTLTLTKIVLAENAGSPLLELERVHLGAAAFDLATRAATLGTLEIGPGRVSAGVDETGTVNWQKLAQNTAPPQPRTTPPAASPEKPESPKTAEAKAKPAKASHAKAAPRAATEPKPKPSPKTEPEGGSAAWKLDLASARILDLALHYADASRYSPIQVDVAKFTGKFALALEGRPEGGLKGGLKNGSLGLSQVSLAEQDGKKPLVGLDQAKVSEILLDLGANDLRVGKVSLKGGGTGLIREKSGSIRLLEVLGPKDRGKIRRELPKVQAKAEREGKPWSLALDRTELDDYAVAVEDRSAEPAPALNLLAKHLAMSGFRSDGKTPIGVEAALQLKEGGTLDASGKVNGGFDRADIQLKIAKLSLSPLKPYVSRYTTLNLASGELSTSGQFNFRQGKSGPSLGYTGELGVADFGLDETDTGQRLLGWQSLAVKGIRFANAPDSLRVSEIRFQRPEAKIVIFKDKTVNLAKIMKSDKSASGKSAEKPPLNPPGKSLAQPKRGGKSGGSGFPMEIDRIRLEKGEVDFADFSLVLPYATHITDFHGGADGVSSGPSKRTSLKFEGRVGQFGEARVQGSLQPFDPKRYFDIGVVFRNVEMPDLSPYSATFAGRRIASGTLDLDLQYEIVDNKLAGENKVLLRDFTLGEQVEAPNAIDLPLDLAIALFTDSQGRINLSLPVRGNVDDPQFDYGEVLWQAFTTLITKTVTAPFRALAGVLGGSDEDLGGILFEPGGFDLSPPEQGKLAKIAEGLKSREQLRITVQGRYDEKLDGEALRTRSVRLALAGKLGMALDADEDPGPVRFDEAETQVALEKLYAAHRGGDAVDKLAAEQKKSTGKTPERVSRFLAGFGKASTDTAFYEALFRQLVELEPLPREKLETLAKERGDTIARALDGFGVPADRITTGKPAAAEQAGAEGVESTLGLEAMESLAGEISQP